MLTSGTPVLGFCTKERSHQNGKQWELCPGNPQNLGNGEPAHKGFVCTLSSPWDPEQKLHLEKWLGHV